MTPEETTPTTTQTVFDLYVVYWDPLDYPGQYVLRQWSIITTIEGTTDSPVMNHSQTSMPHPIPMLVTASLDEARSALPEGLTNIGRYDEDDPAIYEVWV